MTCVTVTELFDCCRLSVSNDLKVDAERDLYDIGAGRIEVHPLNKVWYEMVVPESFKHCNIPICP